MNTRLLAALTAAALLSLPSAALAKGGGGGATTCIPVQAVNSGVVDKPASRKPITVDVQVANCGTSTATLGLQVVPTVVSLRQGLDGYFTETCPGEAYAGQSASLRPGDAKTLAAAARIPYCGVSPWGADVTYTVEYAVSAVDLVTGVVAGTTTSSVRHQGGA